MNTTNLIGNLTANPTVVFTPAGKGITEFTIAINRVFTNGEGERMEEVSFIPCKAFGRVGEIAMQYLEKGRLLALQGRLRQESWEKDGQKRSKLVVVVEKLNLMPGRKHQGEDGEQDAGEPAASSGGRSGSRKRQTAKAA